jgi:hypothetical protein
LRTSKPKQHYGETKMSAYTLQISGGQIAFIRGHVSTSDESIKDRKFQVSTHAGKRQQDLDGQAIDAITAIDIQRLIETATGQDIPITVISAAVKVLEQRVKDRKTGTTNNRPIETIPVAVDKNGRVILQAIKHQRTGEWSLSLGPVEQVWTKTIKAGTVDHKAEAARKLAKCADSAVKQADKWEAQTVKVQSLSSVCALINKVLPRQKGPDIRSFTLIGAGAIKCDSVSIGGHKFDNMVSIVEAFRPDLVSLFNKTQDQSNG